MKRHRVLACPKCGAGDQRDEWVETAVALRVEKQQLEERIAQMEREWDEAEDREQRLQEALREIAENKNAKGDYLCENICGCQFRAKAALTATDPPEAQ